MAISNKIKRKLTCQFCDRNNTCKYHNCDKYWKSIYNKHREEILEIYRKTEKIK